MATGWLIDLHHVLNEWPDPPWWSGPMPILPELLTVEDDGRILRAITEFVVLRLAEPVLRADQYPREANLVKGFEVLTQREGRALADALDEIEQSEYRLDPSLYQLIDVVGAYVRDTPPDGECVASLLTHGPCREEGLALLADLVAGGASAG